MYGLMRLVKMCLRYKKNQLYCLLVLPIYEWKQKKAPGNGNGAYYS